MNCVSCSTTNMCGICNNGYQLANGNCVTCNVTSCNQCSSNNVCSTCAQGYSLTSNGTCVLCSYPCVTCNNDNSCATCSTPFYISTPVNGSCIAATVPNCNQYSTTNGTAVCTQCISS